MSTLSVPQFTHQRPWQQPTSNNDDDAKIEHTNCRSPYRADHGLLMKSTLAGVFGSQTSLSDLAGDADPYHYTYKAHHRDTSSTQRRRRTIDNDDQFLNDINRSLVTPKIVATAPSNDLPVRAMVVVSSSNSSSSNNSADCATGKRKKNPPPLALRRQIVHTWAQAQLFLFGIIYSQLANRFFTESFNTTTTNTISAASQHLLTPRMLPWWAWGFLCVVVGTLVPYLDRTRPAWLEPGFFLPSKAFFYSSLAHTNSLAITATGTPTSSSNSTTTTTSSNSRSISSNGGQKSFISRCDWNSAIRTFAAFLGLGLGVRKLQFSSLGQVASMWALASPVLWFLLDGTWTGLVCGLGVAAAGGALAASPGGCGGGGKDDDSAVLPMVLCLYFCCALCFGNIGRRLMK